MQYGMMKKKRDKHDGRVKQTAKKRKIKRNIYYKEII
jgi:hypothetical protein